MAQDNDAYLITCANREYLAAQAASCLPATLAHLALAELYMGRIAHLTEVTTVERDEPGLKHPVADSGAPIVAKNFVRVNERVGAAEKISMKLRL